MPHSIPSPQSIQFDSSILAGQVSASSLAMYTRDFRTYLDYAGAEFLDPRRFAEWRAFMVAETSYSPHTINRMMTAVRSILREAAARGLIDKFLFGEFQFIRGVKERALKQRIRENNRTRIGREEMRYLCDAPPAATQIGRRDRAMLLTMATSGCRAAEIVSLTTDRILQHGNTFQVMVNGKIDVGWRAAPLSEEAYARIRLWLERRPIESEYVFTAFGGRGPRRLSARPLSTVAAWQIVQKYAAQVGLQHVKPHDFRRYVATQLAKTNLRQAQLALGHLEPKSTLRYYVLDELQTGITDDLV